MSEDWRGARSCRMTAPDDLVERVARAIEANDTVYEPDYRAAARAAIAVVLDAVLEWQWTMDLDVPYDIREFPGYRVLNPKERQEEA